MSFDDLRRKKSSRKSGRKSSIGSKVRRGGGRNPKRGGGGNNTRLIGFGLVIVMVLLAGGYLLASGGNFDDVLTALQPTPTTTAFSLVDGDGAIEVTRVPLSPVPPTRIPPTQLPIVPTSPPAADTGGAVDSTVDTSLLQAAYNAPTNGNFRFSLNFTFEAMVAGQQYLIELIGDGVYVSGETLNDFMIETSLAGLVIQPGSPNAEFDVNVRFINGGAFFQMVPGAGLSGTATPWYRISFQELLGQVPVEVDESEELPPMETFMNAFDLSDFITLRRMPDTQGGRVAQFQREFDVLGVVASEATMLSLIRAIAATDAVDLTQEELEAFYVLGSSMFARAVPTLDIRTNEYVNIDDRTLNSVSLDVDVELDRAQLESLLGTQIPGSENVMLNLDVVLAFSDHGGLFTVDEPGTWENIDLSESGMTMP